VGKTGLEGAITERKQKVITHSPPEREKEREGERESKSYMQLELLQVNHNVVLSYCAQLIGARSMHILHFISKDACELMGS